MNLEFKVVMLGDSRVGKTSIIRRFIDDIFESETVSTYGVSFAKKPLDLPPRVTLVLWDTAGQEKFRSLAALHYKNADAAVLVYDLTARESFEGLKAWLLELRNKAPAGIHLVIAANKADMVEQEKVGVEEGMKLAETENIRLYLTSAKNNTGVEDMFRDLAMELFKARAQSMVAGRWIAATEEGKVSRTQVGITG